MLKLISSLACIPSTKNRYNLQKKWTVQKKQTSTRCRFEARLKSTKANSPICANDKPTLEIKWSKSVYHYILKKKWFKLGKTFVNDSYKNWCSDVVPKGFDHSGYHYSLNYNNEDDRRKQYIHMDPQEVYMYQHSNASQEESCK